jgi:hypothetical protein
VVKRIVFPLQQSAVANDERATADRRLSAGLEVDERNPRTRRREKVLILCEIDPQFLVSALPGAALI